MTYLVWFDDSKKSVEQKIADACHAYAAKLGAAPCVVLISQDESEPSSAPCRWERSPMVRKSLFYVAA